MADIVWNFEVDGNNFELAGFASQETKARLKQLGLPSDFIRRVVIAMYEGEINMAIHANGGDIAVEIEGDLVTITMADTGKGIEDVELAMKEGYSTATSEIRELGFGAGMGLSNMKKYSDYMNIDTAVNVGTTITLKFSIPT